MANDDTLTNGTSEPKNDDETAPAVEGDASVKTSDPPKEAPAKKSKKKGKKGKKGSKSKETDESKKDGVAAEPGADGDKPEEKKKKPIKKKTPHWATVSENAGAKPKAGPTGAGAIGIIIDAIKHHADAKGLASYISIKKYVQKTHPAWPKMTFKTALRRSVDKKCVKQIKNSYKVLSETPVAKATKVVKVTKKVSKGRSKTVTVTKARDGPLEDLFPHIFTWVCEPKEASYVLIRKYIAKHYPKLSPDAPLKKAILAMVAKGQLEQITGKGASGTFALENGAKKTGTVYEDPIEDAIIASNEPKDASIQALRHYLAEFHTEYNVENKPKVLKGAIERAEAKGWLVRVSGKGFGGTFRLGYPYIPSPKDLWREAYEEEKPKKPKKKAPDSSDEEESSDESSEEEEEESDSESEEEQEVIPKSKKRGAPTARSTAPTKKAKVAPKKAAPKKKPAPKKASPKKKSAPPKKVAKKTKKATPKKKPAAAGAKKKGKSKKK